MFLNVGDLYFLLEESTTISVTLTKHSIERFAERLNILSVKDALCLANHAWLHGFSARDFDFFGCEDKCRMYLEQKATNCIPLLYEGVIYIFSRSRHLITLYPVPHALV